MALKARKDICGNCLFHHDVEPMNGEHRFIQCRYNPPRVFMAMVPVGPAPGVLSNPAGQKQQQVGMRFFTSFPTQDPELWCGKHYPMEDEKESG